MVISEPQSHAVQGDRENVIQAFNDWRAKEPAISEAVLRTAFPERPSVARRVFRTIALGFMAVLIAVAIMVLQSGSHEIGDIVSALQGSLTRLSAVTHGPPAASRGTPAAATAQPTEEQYNPITQQIKAVANELIDLRRIVEQLATSQEKMAEDIAALKANEQSINQKLSSALPHHPPGSAVARTKPGQTPVTGAAGRSPTERSSVGAPLPLR